ncbi:MAG: hypothetical protein COX77_01310 [Candidatus Komeilibacteria bacterium CG_4_10_14_0_2_um_filter_37_10]|uniref:Uncharacterized protein n=1 Tax=Candidatus Komeilibacteria bacterium CG_4_10_14_0_2_um_filter_37_10 TaxID=1974470 RepID=A0A2M7VFT7_9BACT|nr:MAG: hypothetical protein COX77_01310 [Candidatus Komeilibacteria bacterium CG_4_10_14_0_2_um_filter_37_10]
MSIKDKILIKIKDQEIKPKPRWYWRVLQIIKWTLISFLLILSGCAVSATMYLLHEREWDVAWQAANNFGEYLLMILPIFWLVFLSLALIIIYYEYRQTKEGYKYQISSVIGITILISLALGGIIYAFDINYDIDQQVNAQPQFNYSSTEFHRRDVWSRPSRGFLAGEIILISDGQRLNLLDFNHQQWQVFYQHAQIRPRAVLQQGELIKVMGQVNDDNVFNAVEIRPWQK